MAGDLIWTKGAMKEFSIFEDHLARANPEGLVRLKDELRNGMGVMEAFSQFIFGSQLPELADVADRWFGTSGGEPQWLWDSVLSTGQMQLVMQEGTALLAELLLVNRKAEVELWLQCGHPRFRMVLAWDSDADRLAEPLQLDSATGTLASWPPTKVRKVRVWVYVPFNAGYKEGITRPNPDGEAMLRELVARVETAGGIAEHMDPMMTLEELDTIVDNFPVGWTPWRGTPLALKPTGASRTDRNSLTFKYLPAFDEPPPYMPQDEARQLAYWSHFPADRRNAQALEISSNTTKQGHLIYHTWDTGDLGAQLPASGSDPQQQQR